MRRLHKPTVADDQPRGGIATVEIAVMLPLLLVLTFGSIEAANAIFLKQTVTIAAYEATKIAAKNGGTTQMAETRCSEFLASRGITSYTFTTTPGNVTQQTERGTQISVQLSVSASASAAGPWRFYNDTTISKTVTMVRL